MVPLVLLYEVGILLATRIEHKRASIETTVVAGA
jgi:Sec-independent protein secretion pathway component TatC